MRCCNAEWNTNFCGGCGRQLRDLGTVESLLQHVSINARNAVKKYQAFMGRMESMSPGSEREKFAKTVQKNKFQAEKWKSWEVELGKLIDQRNTKDMGFKDEENISSTT